MMQKMRSQGHLDKDEFTWVFPKIGVFPPKWMVKIMENPVKMDDLKHPHVATVGIRTDWLPGRCKGNCRHLEGMENLFASQVLGRFGQKT